MHAVSRAKKSRVLQMYSALDHFAHKCLYWCEQNTAILSLTYKNSSRIQYICGR